MSPRDDWEEEMIRFLNPAPAVDTEGDVVVSVIAENPDVATELESFLRDLHGLAEQPAPPPSAELEEAFASTTFARRLDEIHARRARRRRRRIAVTAAAICATSVSLTGVAAATDQLPGGAQHVVSNVIDNLTPFHVDDGSKPTPPAPPSQPSTVPTQGPVAGGHPGSKSGPGPTSTPSGHGGGVGSGSHDGGAGHPTQSPTQPGGHGPGGFGGSGGTGGSGGSGSGSHDRHHPPSGGSSGGHGGWGWGGR